MPQVDVPMLSALPVMDELPLGLLDEVCAYYNSFCRVSSSLTDAM